MVYTSGQDLKIREHPKLGVFVENLAELVVKNHADVMRFVTTSSFLLYSSKIWVGSYKYFGLRFMLQAHGTRNESACRGVDKYECPIFKVISKGVDRFFFTVPDHTVYSP